MATTMRTVNLNELVLDSTNSPDEKDKPQRFYAGLDANECAKLEICTKQILMPAIDLFDRKTLPPVSYLTHKKKTTLVQFSDVRSR
jgi:hypothetical protein